MAISCYFITTVILLLTSLMFNISARPISDAKSNGYTVDGAIRDAVEVFNIAAIKIGGGPSPGGKGHEFPIADFFGNIKNSGPSPSGKGHYFTNANVFGDIKNSGPSPGGKGHDFTDANVLGGIKNSGPSPGGKGHEFPDADSLGSIKNSGPSAGGKGHEFPTSVETLGNILNSSFNHGGNDCGFSMNDQSAMETTTFRPWN